MIPKTYSQAVSELSKRAERKRKRVAKAALMGSKSLKNDQESPLKVKKARKVKAPTRKAQVKKIKQRILGPGGKWSVEVRARDGACVMCGKTEGLPVAQNKRDPSFFSNDGGKTGYSIDDKERKLYTFQSPK